MKDNRYYELRELTETIFQIRMMLMDMDKSTYEHEKTSKIYNELCKQREALEAEIFNKNE